MKTLHNFGRMIVFVLRRDRLYLPLWIIGMIALAVFFVPMMPEFLGNGQSAATLSEMMKNPAMVAMMGLSYGEGMGPMYAQFMLVWATLGLALFNILFVVRHTRKEEERGQNELIIALPVGRNANLFATLKVVFFADLIVAVAAAVLIPAFGIEGLDLPGALFFGLAFGVGGFAFAVVTALFAQLFSTSRSTNIAAFVFLAVCFMLRAAGDMDASYEIMALVSPLGLIERTQVWVENLIWPICVLFLVSLCVGILSLVLSSYRDVGAGMFPSRNGKRHASRLLSNEWGLAWRLTRGIFIGWLAVMFVLGASYGTVINNIGSFLESSMLYTAIIGTGEITQGEMVNTFVSFIIMLMAIIAAIPICMIVLKLKSEEKHGLMEQVLARSFSRTSYLLAYVVIAAVLSIGLLIATPLGMYASASTMMDVPPELASMMITSLNYLPALLIFIGLATLFVGLSPKFSPLVWVLLVYCFMIAYMGNLAVTMVEGAAKDVFDAVTNISPFALLPLLPQDDASAVITVSVTVVAIVCVIAGSVLYRRRDIRENI